VLRLRLLSRLHQQVAHAGVASNLCSDKMT
jgi:hypothetical protein